MEQSDLCHGCENTYAHAYTYTWRGEERQPAAQCSEEGTADSSD